MNTVSQNYFFNFVLNTLLHILFTCFFSFIFYSISKDYTFEFLLHRQNIWNSIILVLIAHLIAIITIDIFYNFPGDRSALSIVPSVCFAFFSIFFVILLFRLQHSVPIIFIGYIFSIIFCYLLYSHKSKGKRTLVYIPLGRANDLYKIDNINWIRLDKPTLPKENFSAIVVDLHSPDLSDEWQRFLADITLSGIPVLNIRQVEESITGRIKIKHMYENDLGSLLPSKSYLWCKQILDSILIILTVPITLPIMIITAIIIKLESSGPILFIQKRVGQGGKEFYIYKFRSMCQDSEKKGAQFASADDIRITKVGKFIRKTRIDELPQFFNILKGNMSLIGPRPEQKYFVEEFEKTIPFYNYRHIVKPGISGWAQVIQGYAADTEETQIKVEHDFYYIKNISLSLDTLIFFKTIKTMLTGFGAR